MTRRPRCAWAYRSASAGLLVSTDPASGPWTTTNSSFQASDAACPSASLCIAVGQSGVSISTDPASGAWTTYALPVTPQSITCPTTSFCAVGSLGNGYAFTSTDPAGGAGTWTPVLADPIGCATSPSACSTEKIIASDRNGLRQLAASTGFAAQTGPQLTGLTLTGDTLSWNDHGSLTSAQLTR